MKERHKEGHDRGVKNYVWCRESDEKLFCFEPWPQQYRGSTKASEVEEGNSISSGGRHPGPTRSSCRNSSPTSALWPHPLKEGSDPRGMASLSSSLTTLQSKTHPIKQKNGRRGLFHPAQSKLPCSVGFAQTLDWRPVAGQHQWEGAVALMSAPWLPIDLWLGEQPAGLDWPLVWSLRWAFLVYWRNSLGERCACTSVPLSGYHVPNACSFTWSWPPGQNAASQQFFLFEDGQQYCLSLTALKGLCEKPKTAPIEDLQTASPQARNAS